MTTPTPTLAPRIDDIRPSATLRINERSNALIAQGRDVIKFGLGQSPFPVPAPIVASLKENAAEKDYLPVQGLPALREAVAAYHREWDQLDFSADDIVVAPGSKELMFLLQLVLDAELVVPTPCWVSYTPQADILGRPVRRIATSRESRWRLSAEQLDEVCRAEGTRSRLLIFNDPGNPLGTTYSAAELAALAEVARRHGVIVLSDEIYGELHHTGEHESFARHYPEGTIVSNGISKWCGAGGWRLGTFAFPPALAAVRRALCAVGSETYSAVCAPVQFAAVDAWKREPWMLDYLCSCRRVIRALGNFGADTLRSAGAAVDGPTGGFYLWVDFTPMADRLAAHGIEDSTTLCDRILEDTGVAFLPGFAFERPANELTARIAYVDFDGGRALDAVAAHPADRPLGREFLAESCGRSVAGFERIAAWLQAR